MSTREALIQELMKQPEQVLLELQRHLHSLTSGKNGNDATRKSTWPEAYFEHTAGAFANEPFEHPGRLPFEKREDW